MDSSCLIAGNCFYRVIDDTKGDRMQLCKQPKLPIKHIRLREKLSMFSEDEISNRELLAILLRTGDNSRKLNALMLAEDLLEKYSGLSGIAFATVKELAKEKGIGLAKACQIKAATALGKRTLDTDLQEQVIRNSNDAFKCVRSIFSQKNQESFVVLHLNSNNCVTGRYVVSTGTLDYCPCHPREIFSQAIRNQVAAVIIAHNHPSNSLRASKEDITATDKLCSAGKLLGINVLDHIIVANSGYFSFADNFMLQEQKKVYSN